MKKFARFAICAAIFVVATPALKALPLSWAPPEPQLGNLDRDGTLLVVDDLREVDFGEGLRLPIRWVYRSSDASSSAYGWDGFSVTILESKAVKEKPSLYVVTMPSGELEYFSKDANNIWKSNNARWTGAETGGGTIFTITRWDGWEIEFRDGLIHRLETDDNRTLRWDRDATNPALVTKIHEPATSTTGVELAISSDPIVMIGAGSSRGAASITINGDTYNFKYENGTLKDVEFPDGRKTQWRFENVATNESRLTLTQETG